MVRFKGKLIPIEVGVPFLNALDGGKTMKFRSRVASLSILQNSTCMNDEDHFIFMLLQRNGTQTQSRCIGLEDGFLVHICSVELRCRSNSFLERLEGDLEVIVPLNARALSFLQSGPKGCSDGSEV